jgi:phasin family protein
MATSTESFLDPAKLGEELKNVLRGSKLPGIDVDALVASERKNVEAVTEAGRATFEGMQAIGKRQIEIFQETMNEATKAYDALTKSGSPPEVVAKETEIAKEAFQKGLSNMRELAEMVTQAQHEVMDRINVRIAESLDELKQMALKAKESPVKNEPSS